MSARSSAKKWLKGDGRFVDGDEEGMAMAYIAGYDEGRRAAQQLAEADAPACQDCGSQMSVGYVCKHCGRAQWRGAAQLASVGRSSRTTGGTMDAIDLVLLRSLADKAKFLSLGHSPVNAIQRAWALVSEGYIHDEDGWLSLTLLGREAISEKSPPNNSLKADTNADIVSSLLRVAAYMRTNKCVSPYRDAGRWCRDVADKLEYIARYAAGVRAA